MRINDSFEAIKAEFEALMNEVELCKNQKEEVEVKCTYFYSFSILLNLIILQ